VPGAAGARDPVLAGTLERARTLGFLGPGPVEDHIAHSEGFVAAYGRTGRPPPARLVDLGAGGGVPGLILARWWPMATVVLLEANGRRAAFLGEAVEQLGMAGRVAVLHARAETAGRDGEHRGRYDLVAARSFGAPAVTAECSAPLLALGGVLIVSDPPDAPSDVRWPPEGLAELGLGPAEAVREGFSYAVLRQVAVCPERFARRVGVPAKRPLF